jgi:hypothetical protein
VLPTAAPRVKSQMRSCGICGGQSVTGANFLRVLPQNGPSHLPTGAGTAGPQVADLPSEPSLTTHHELISLLLLGVMLILLRKIITDK